MVITYLVFITRDIMFLTKDIKRIPKDINSLDYTQDIPSRDTTMDTTISLDTTPNKLGIFIFNPRLDTISHKLDTISHRLDTISHRLDTTSQDINRTSSQLDILLFLTLDITQDMLMQVRVRICIIH